MDPGSVPAELQRLSQTEEMLIARCCPIIRVIHLKGGQLGSDARPNQCKKEYYRLSSTCGAPRNHTNVQPVDAHV